MDKILKYVEIPDAVKCMNCKCNDPDHRKQIDSFTDSLVETLIEAAHLIPKKVIKNNKKAKKEKVPWNNELNELKQNASLRNEIWVSLGKPQNSEAHKIARKSKNKYHLALRKCRRAANYLKEANIINNCPLEGYS